MEILKQLSVILLQKLSMYLMTFFWSFSELNKALTI